MPDIGFWELCIIAVIALVVLGPERLPTAARTTGRWVNKARRMVNSLKAEIDRELQLDEVKQKLKEQEQKLKEQETKLKTSVTDPEALEKLTSQSMNEAMLADIQSDSSTKDSNNDESK